MLSKTLKHDMRSILPLWLFLSGLTLAISLVFGFSLRDIILNEMREDYIPILAIFGIIVSMFVVIGYAIATVIFVAVRFYQNFYTDEGYLTFTLPVPRRTLFFSKVLSGVIFVFSTTVVIIASIAIALAIAPSAHNDTTPLLVNAVQGIAETFSLLFDNLADGALLVGYAVVVLLIALVNAVYQVLAMFLCITVGSVLAKKWKVAAAILCYYVANLVIGSLSSIGQFLSIFTAPALFVLLATIAQNLIGVSILLLLLIALGALVIITAIIYQCTLHLIEKKLNLP